MTTVELKQLVDEKAAEAGVSDAFEEIWPLAVKLANHRGWQWSSIMTGGIQILCEQVKAGRAAPPPPPVRSVTKGRTIAEMVDASLAELGSSEFPLGDDPPTPPDSPAAKKKTGAHETSDHEAKKKKK